MQECRSVGLKEYGCIGVCEYEIAGVLECESVTVCEYCECKEDALTRIHAELSAPSRMHAMIATHYSTHNLIDIPVMRTRAHLLLDPTSFALKFVGALCSEL